MSDRDTASGLILILLSLAGAVYSNQLPDTATTGLSSGFYPTILFVILGLCGLSIMVQGLRRSSKVALPRLAWGKIVPFVILLLLYAYLFEILGFRATTLVFLASAMLFLGVRSPLYLIGVPMVSTFGIYWLFTAVFRLALP